MVVNLRAKKRLVSRIMGVGIHRVRFDSEHLDDIADAKGLELKDIITEVEAIVNSGTRLNIDYYINDILVTSSPIYK